LPRRGGAAPSPRARRAPPRPPQAALDAARLRAVAARAHRWPADRSHTRCAGGDPVMRLRITHRAGLVLTCAVALAAYAPSLGNGFAYDDVPVILLDSRVHSLGNLAAILGQPYWPAGGQELAIWRPLTTLSFAVDWALSSGAPLWFHLTNVLWHAAACGLAFLLLSALFTTPAALAGALIFAVHPVHAEAVANVVGRAE